MPRAFWKGYLKLSLVTCPVTMSPATSDSERLRFRTLNRSTGHPVASRLVDSVTGKPVREEDEARGYPTGETTHVILEEDEIDAVALESARTIDIETFVPASSIGWIWLDRPHFLKPDDAVGEEAFAVIRAAMEATSTVGIARLVLYRRERAVMLQPRGKGIVVWTLRYGDEVRADDEYFAGVGHAKADKAALALIGDLIERQTRDWSEKLVHDPVQERLQEIIAAKKKGRKSAAKPRQAEADAPAANVVNIMDALRRSIAAEKKAR